MAEHTFKFKHGLRIGDTDHVECVIREATAGDVIDAQAASERVVPTPDGPRLVMSDARMGMEMARRQIVRIGGVKGNPLAEDEFRMLHTDDLEILNMELEKLDAAGVAELQARRGRDSGVGETD